MDRLLSEVLVRPNPSSDSYLVEWRHPDTGSTTRFHVGRCTDRTHWLIYDPMGVPLVRASQLERAIDFAARLARAEI
jgi:hypothetical protein